MPSESPHRTTLSFPDVEETPEFINLILLFAIRVRVTSSPEAFTTSALTTMEPIVSVVFVTSVALASIVTLRDASSAARTDASMFDSAALVATHTPSINEPFVLGSEVTVT